MLPPPPTSTLFPYTTLFRSSAPVPPKLPPPRVSFCPVQMPLKLSVPRSADHTSAHQIPDQLDCGTLPEITSRTPFVPPPGTTRKLPLANSTLSPFPSALYTP